MSTGLFVTEGDYEPATQSYTYRGQMPDPMHPGAMIAVRNVVGVVDPDHHVFEMYETRDGKEVERMQIEYSRVR